MGLVLAVAGAAAEERTITVLDGRKFAVTTPPGWTMEETSDPRTGLPTIRLENLKGEILLTVTFFPDSKGLAATPEALEATMRRFFASYLDGAVEKEMRISSFEAPDGFGAYTSFTDRTLAGKKKVPKDQRLNSTTGIRSWKGAFLMFTLLSNSRDTETYRQALQIVRSDLREIAGPDPQVKAAPAKVPLTSAGAPWVLILPGEGFEVRERKQSSDGRSEYYLLTNEKTGFNVSAFIEPAQKCRSSRECRDMIQKTACSNLGEVQKSVAAEITGVSTFECFVSEFQGVALNQQHVFAQYVVEGYWVDLHISKVRYTDADRVGLEQIVSEAAFVRKGSAP